MTGDVEWHDSPHYNVILLQNLMLIVARYNKSNISTIPPSTLVNIHCIGCEESWRPLLLPSALLS